MSRTDDLSGAPGYKAFQTALIRTAADLSRLSAAAATADIAALVTGAEERLEHFAEGNFVIAVIGSFKRGKSTLVNALLGDQIMPADINPATATLNRVVYGRTPRATLKMKAGKSVTIPVEALSEHVTKLTDESAERAQDIEEAVIEFPTLLCSNNVQLLDTPGLGDEAAMTALTESVLSKIDAALFVTNATTALSASELKDLEQLLQHVDKACVTLVVTHFDEVEEKDRERLLDNVRKRAAPLLGPDFPVFGIAARNALKAKRARDDGALRDSGLPLLEGALERFLVRESGFARLRAANETVHNLAAELAGGVSEKLHAAEGIDNAQATRLSMLLTEFDAVKTGLDQWKADIVVWVGHGAKDKLNDDVAAALGMMARGAVPPLTKSDVTNGEARHQRLRAIINPKLKDYFNGDIDRLRELLVAEAVACSTSLVNLAARWNIVRSAQLDTPDSHGGKEVIDPFLPTDTAFASHENHFENAKKRFAEQYDLCCNYLSFGGMIRSMFDNVTEESIREIEQKTRDHVDQTARVACKTGDRTSAVENYLTACKVTMMPFAETLSADIADSIDRLKWDLELKAAREDTARAVQKERLRLSRATAEEVQRQAERRRDVLQQLAIPPAPESGDAQLQPQTA